MRHFLRLVENIKRQGVLGISKKTGNWELCEFPKEHWKRIEECQPIVFSRLNDAPQDAGEDALAHGDFAHIHLDAPFKTFSVEMMDGPISVPRDTDEIRVTIYCIVAMEMGPKTWAFLPLCQREDGSEYVFASNAEGLIVNELVKRLNTERIGSQQVRERVKIGTGKEKRTHTIRRIVYVAPKPLETPTPTGQSTIDWTHRFLVRGHWRQTPGLGKDRDGNYCVQGHTWVTEHIRGPEHLPVITKTRVVVD